MTRQTTSFFIEEHPKGNLQIEGEKRYLYQVKVGEKWVFCLRPIERYLMELRECIDFVHSVKRSDDEDSAYKIICFV